ncbi:MAG TPA: methyl-accepting chemotaxis protein [Candidatus Eisenbacteria bacterium]|nr:methyl-accepting chemotaxis protein [Candidatus Eisenbacteria bacterium]
MGVWKTWSLSSKIVSLIVAVLLTTLGINFWVTQLKVNEQAEKAFSDKLKTMTDVALGSRVSNEQGGHAWEVAQRYAKTQGYIFRTPATSPMNPEHTSSAFDERAFAALEADGGRESYVERDRDKGRDVMLFARPVVVTEDCKACHSWAVTVAAGPGEKRVVPALFSIEAPLDTLAANERSNARTLVLAAVMTLFLTSGTVIFVLRRLVVRPLKDVLQLANRMAANDLRQRLAVSSEDEIGQMVKALNTALEEISGAIQSVAENAEHVASASAGLSDVSREITANSEEATSKATLVSNDTEQVSRNLQTVATGAEEMRATMQEISRNATESARVAEDAVQKAEATNATVSKLGASSAEIGKVVRTITTVAEQINLLALNATIEATRAGEAGSGFAVVANEVKELANQTAKATEEIGAKIAAIQSDTKGAVEAIGSIRGVIRQISELSGMIAGAVRQQGETTDEMSRNLMSAAKSSGDITHNITEVAHVAQGTTSRARDSLKAATQLAGMSTDLKNLVEQFKVSANGELQQRGI